jgi:hypothetical protein
MSNRVFTMPRHGHPAHWNDHPSLRVFRDVEGDGSKRWKKTYTLKRHFTEAAQRERPALENGRFSWQSQLIPLRWPPASHSVLE